MKFDLFRTISNFVLMIMHRKPILQEIRFLDLFHFHFLDCYIFLFILIVNFKIIILLMIILNLFNLKVFLMIVNKNQNLLDMHYLTLSKILNLYFSIIPLIISQIFILSILIRKINFIQCYF